MLIRSINGETPEGAVPVEDRDPNTEADYMSASVLGWLRRHPGKGPIIKNSIYRILQ